jgi:hypothetical protein
MDFGSSEIPNVKEFINFILGGMCEICIIFFFEGGNSKYQNK